jgi:hypothetical protein
MERPASARCASYGAFESAEARSAKAEAKSGNPASAALHAGYGFSASTFAVLA